MGKSKYFKFKTACITKNELDQSEYFKELGIESSSAVDITYKDLAVNLNHIVYYYPLRAVEMGNKNTDYLDDETSWVDAEYINLVLVDGSELTININIQDFEYILNEDDK